MTNYLDASHYMNRAVAIVTGDSSLTGALDLRVCTVQDLDYYPAVHDLSDNLPAVLVNIQDPILETAVDEHVTGILFEWLYPIRVVYINTFDVGDNVMSRKADEIGQLHGKFISVMTDVTTSWAKAGTQSQVYGGFPRNIELRPPEEFALRTLFPNRQLYAAAFTVDVETRLVKT